MADSKVMRAVSTGWHIREPEESAEGILISLVKLLRITPRQMSYIVKTVSSQEIFH
jgi:hypothetical protein